MCRSFFILLVGVCVLAAAVARATSEPAAGVPAGTAVATFAGGCFWCMEPPFDKLDGVIRTTSGYTGGTLPNPTYKQVSSGRSGHIESVQIVFDPARVSFEKLLQVYWRNIDPTDNQGQFCDKGAQYRPVIFYHDATQQRLAQASMTEIAGTRPFAEPLRVELLPAGPFYAAEEYHQDFYRKNPVRYKFYRLGCGRDRRLRELWGDYQA